MSWWTVIAVASSAMKAYGTYMQGMATKAYYDAKADISLLQYKEKRDDMCHPIQFHHLFKYYKW